MKNMVYVLVVSALLYLHKLNVIVSCLAYILPLQATAPKLTVSTWNNSTFIWLLALVYNLVHSGLLPFTPMGHTDKQMLVPTWENCISR
jgi:hypothetical protein